MTEAFPEESCLAESEQTIPLQLVRPPLPPSAWREGDPVIGFDQDATVTSIIPGTCDEKFSVPEEEVKVEAQDITQWIAHATSEELADHHRKWWDTYPKARRYPSPIVFNGVLYGGRIVGR